MKEINDLIYYLIDKVIWDFVINKEPIDSSLMQLYYLKELNKQENSVDRIEFLFDQLTESISESSHISKENIVKLKKLFRNGN